MAKSKKSQSAVVIGAGVIGIEMAGALRSQGKDVKLLEVGKNISPSIADSEFAEKILDHLNENGIETFFDTKIVEVKKIRNKKTKIIISSKRKKIEIETDLLVIAAGVRPNLQILEGTKIKATEKGIVVNEKMQTNITDVYAAGDCCVPLSFTGEYKPSSLASSAIQQSKIVGYQIAGFPISYSGSTGAFAFQTMGREYAKVGLSEAEARKKYKWVITGKAQTTDVYKDLKICKPLETKLIFAGPSMRLVGMEAFGNGVITSAEVASFAIGQKTNILKMLKYNYIAHPSMTAWPFMNPIIMATEDAMGSIMNKLKKFGIKI